MKERALIITRAFPSAVAAAVFCFGYCSGSRSARADLSELLFALSDDDGWLCQILTGLLIYVS